MSFSLPTTELAPLFASLDRKLDKRREPPPGEVDETRREVELILADIDKNLVLLGYGEGDIMEPMGQRVSGRLEKLTLEEWSKPLPTDPAAPTLLEYVLVQADQVTNLLGE